MLSLRPARCVVDQEGKSEATQYRRSSGMSSSSGVSHGIGTPEILDINSFLFLLAEELVDDRPLPGSRVCCW